ncbi:MAG: DUF695 domain-containing protein [Muribaculaceae bacterium]|nr:DUF695 domain-containing protein [Muribaculaceae bacterium]
MDKGDWWTSPTEADNGQLIMVTGRRDIDTFRRNPRFNIRVEVTWRYQSDSTGMPDEATSKLMEDVQDAMQAEFIKDPVAVLTGIYTGAGERNWVFYTLSTHIFGRKINECLAPFDLLPITIYTENDPDWAEYDEMKAASEINPE